MISELFLRDYFKDLAERSVELQHHEDRKSFFVLRGLYLDEFEAALTNMANPKGLIIEMGEGTFGSDDNVQDNPDMTLYFVIRTDGLYENIDAARDEAKLIAAKFLAKMRYDQQDQYQRVDNIAGILKQHKVKFNLSGGYRNLGNVGDDERWTGKMIEIKFSGSGETDLVHNPNDWRP
jgi:hypothetical protein